MNTNFKQIESYIHTFEIEFDIIAISETWNDPTTLQYYDLPKYNSFQVCREDAREGGVAIHVHKDIKCSKCISKSLSVNGIFECVTVELAISNKKNIIVSCMYRKPGSNIDIFCENVESIFENIPYNKTIFVCGDFNIDILKQDRHPSTKHFIDIIYSLGLYPLITKPTRITKDTATLIDNIFTNAIDKRTVNGILINDITDHFPVFSLCDYGVIKKHTEMHKCVREHTTDNLKYFVQYLGRDKWGDITSATNVNVAYDTFLSAFIKKYEKHCPLRKINKIHVNKEKTWITVGIKNACHKKIICINNL